MRVNICPVNCSVITYVLLLATGCEAVLVTPEPELAKPYKVIDTVGNTPAGVLSAFSKVRSGPLRPTRRTRLPSPLGPQRPTRPALMPSRATTIFFTTLATTPLRCIAMTSRLTHGQRYPR